MQNSIVHRLLALLLAIYMPLALVGVPLHKHYCEGKLADIRVFIEAESCHDSGHSDEKDACCSKESSCHSDSDQKESEKEDCCDDELEFLKADVNQITYKNEFKKQVDFHIILVSLFILQSYDNNQIAFLFDKNLELTAPFPDGKSRLINFGHFLC